MWNRGSRSTFLNGVSAFREERFKFKPMVFKMKKPMVLKIKTYGFSEIKTSGN